MNVIHQLQDKIERMQEVIDAQKDSLRCLYEYAISDKFRSPCSTMNPADITLRIDVMNSRIRDIGDNGRAVVDDDKEALVKRAVVEVLREIKPLVKKNHGIASVYRSFMSNVRVEFYNSESTSVETNLQDAYADEKEEAITLALTNMIVDEPI